MAILQGFPAHYFFEGALAAKYNQIGDAVPPLISNQIAQYIISLKSTQSPTGDYSQQYPRVITQLELLEV